MVTAAVEFTVVFILDTEVTGAALLVIVVEEVRILTAGVVVGDVVVVVVVVPQLLWLCSLARVLVRIIRTSSSTCCSNKATFKCSQCNVQRVVAN